MALINDNYLKLKAGYLFPEIARRVKAFTEANPEAAKRLIRCGIGDVTEPLPAAVRDAMHEAVDEMGDRETFNGYGPEQGYDFLRKAIAEQRLQGARASTSTPTRFSSPTAPSATPATSSTSSARATRSPSPIRSIPSTSTPTSWPATPATPTKTAPTPACVYLKCNAATTASCPPSRRSKVDLIYLCFPNNPTGAVATRAQLEAWVNYAHANDTHHPLRRRLRGLHPGPGDPALASTRSKARAIAPSSSAASRRTAASPACAAPSS